MILSKFFWEMLLILALFRCFLRKIEKFEGVSMVSFFSVRKMNEGKDSFR